jgi:WD40 repeat protein
MRSNIDMSSRSSKIPSRLLVVAGTYDGVLAGWDTAAVDNSNNNNKATIQDATDVNNNKFDDQKLELQLLRRKGCDGKYLKLIFAMAAHEGSVRCLDIACGGASHAAAGDDPFPKTLLSGGYDETINVYNLYKRSQEGDLKTPNDLGSPLCCSFAPPSSSVPSHDDSSTNITSTHAMIGTTSGKIILYKNNKDWSVEHVLSGHHPTEVSCLAVHPTGKLALSGGRSDGKLMLWDLMKGRLAYVHKVVLSSSSKRRKEATTINHIVWSGDGMRYAYCYGTKITVKDANSGEDLLDVEMPGRVNQLAFIGGREGMFVAAACDDGGLPVLEVGNVVGGGFDDDIKDNYGDNADGNTRHAIMAIEPVDKIVAGDDRFKCIRSVEGGSGFLVVTANSGGVVSLMDLEGAVRMMLTTPAAGGGGDGNGSSDDNDDDGDADDKVVEAAVEILDSVRIGSGARITDLTAWSLGGENDRDNNPDDTDGGSATNDGYADDELTSTKKTTASSISHDADKLLVTKKRKGEDLKKSFAGRDRNSNRFELNDEAVEKARKLVGQAKKHQKRKQKQRDSTTS